jgi:hypothetical protein
MSSREGVSILALITSTPCTQFDFSPIPSLNSKLDSHHHTMRVQLSQIQAGKSYHFLDERIMALISACTYFQISEMCSSHSSVSVAGHACPITVLPM